MRWWKRLLMVGLLVPALAACSDDPAGADDDDNGNGGPAPEQEVNNVAFIRLVIGSATIVVNRTGTVIGPTPIVGPPGAEITAFFLDANSQPLTISNTDFRLDVTPDNTGRVAFTRTGPFTGSFTRNAAGPVTITIGLFHISRSHYDFGPHPIQVTAQ